MKKLTILIIMIMVTIGGLFAEEAAIEDKHKTSGFAIELGYGNAFAGYGIMGEFFFHNEFLSSSIFIGAGYFPSISIDGIGETESSNGTVIGSRIYMGDNHRIVIETTYGFIGVQAAWLYTDGEECFVQEDIIGFSLSFGYQYMGPDGGIFTITIGKSIADTDYFGKLSLPTFNIGFGQKF
ncbi:hypothetical protein KAS08_00355 [Candidatus Pacearchaeota archaeon]|nr:hypothetical protein [Candidatus Pacearchaeota archaeon]